MSRTRSPRRAGAVAVAAALLVLGPAAGAAAVEGPGYGGTARDLTVTWSPQAPAVAAAAVGRLAAGASALVPAVAPASSSMALDVRGLGFRSSSLVTVRVGAGEAFTARTDAAGALLVQVPAALAGGTEPGVSVVAAGRNPAGTAVTLVGSVPPVPAGTGPQDAVVWLVAAALGSWGAVVLVRRLRRGTALVAAPVIAAVAVPDAAPVERGPDRP